VSATDISTGEDIPARVRTERRGLPRRLMFWRSPEDQPGWARPVLLGIAALAALLYAWNISESGYAYFYSVAVKSMSVSWKAFFYGALDPRATITIDKLAGSFAPQALSARIFGFHQWALTLPQVIEGVISVLAMYRVVRRWFGVPAGLLAAGIFTFTPILASMYGHPMEDGLLTMCLVLAADCCWRAVSEARLASLVWAGVWIGVGFQAKMLQAWMVLPALAITYLFIAPAPLRRRFAHLAVAGVVMLAVSLSWILLFTVTPANDRPYVDGSTDNNAFVMVFGYNGLERFGINVPGSVVSMFGGSGSAPRAVATRSTGSPVPVTSGGAPEPDSGQQPGGGFPGARGAQAGGLGGGNGGGTSGFGSSQGWTKLLGTDYGSQIGWLYPLALLSLVLGFVWHRRRGRSDPARGGFLFWGLWLATYAAIFSKMTLPHTAYLASLAPPIAALAAVGIVMFWRAYRDGRAVWALPLAIALETAWTLHLSAGYSNFLPWLGPLVVIVAVVCVLVLIVARFSALVRRRVLLGSMGVGVAAMLVTPGAWAASVLDPTYGGSAFNASAGPGGAMGGPVAASGPTIAGLNLPASIEEEFARRAGGSAGPGGGALLGSATLTAAEVRLDTYLTGHRDGAEFLAATESWTTAAPYITATGQAFLPMGGFSGSVPEPTMARVEQLVDAGELRYFLLDATGAGVGTGGSGSGSSSGSSSGGQPGGFAGPGAGSSATGSSIASWVRSSCTVVPASAYGGTSVSATTAPGSAGGQSLYLCAATS
jgi:4-amino-4-deoxy-L-arabinose transferase-like glycosyltransferase